MSNNEASSGNGDGGNDLGDHPNNNPGVNPDDTTQESQPFQRVRISNSQGCVNMDTDGIYSDVAF